MSLRKKILRYRLATYRFTSEAVFLVSASRAAFSVKLNLFWSPVWQNSFPWWKNTIMPFFIFLLSYFSFFLIYLLLCDLVPDAHAHSPIRPLRPPSRPSSPRRVLQGMQDRPSQILGMSNSVIRLKLFYCNRLGLDECVCPLDYINCGRSTPL